ncbi:MAG: hypothetical protein Pars2KO_20290 [Parasphingorhabdus sp.]
MEGTNSSISNRDRFIFRVLGAFFFLLSLCAFFLLMSYGLVALDGSDYSYVGDTSGDRLERKLKFAAFFGLYIIPMIGIAIWNVRDSFLLFKNSNPVRLKYLLVKSGVAIFLTILFFSIVSMMDPF